MGGARRLPLKHVRVPQVQIDSQSRPKRPPVGGSYCRVPQDPPYLQRTSSLLHYPPVAAVGNTRTANGGGDSFHRPEPFDWLTARDRPIPIEHADQYGSNTLRISGVPFGVTNQELEEQLRRLFFRFGPIIRCRSEPHPRDQFQSSGVAHIAFKYQASAKQALLQGQFVLRCGLHAGVLHVSSPSTLSALPGEKNPRTMDWHARERFAASQISEFARLLFEHLGRKECATGGSTSWPQPVIVRCGTPALLLSELPRVPLVGLSRSVALVFGSWEGMLDSQPLSQLFALEPLKFRPPQYAKRGIAQRRPARRACRNRASSPRMFEALCSKMTSLATDTATAPHRLSHSSGSLDAATYKMRSQRSLLPSRRNTPFIDRQFRRQAMLFHSGPSNGEEFVDAAGAGYLDAAQFLASPRHSSGRTVRSQILAHDMALAVHRRPIPQDRAEVCLQLVERAALAMAEKRRWALAGGSSTLFIPTDELLRMKRFFRKPPLPETLQRLSKPEYLYRRIHDEKHILHFNLTERKAREAAYAQLEQTASKYNS